MVCETQEHCMLFVVYIFRQIISLPQAALLLGLIIKLRNEQQQQKEVLKLPQVSGCRPISAYIASKEMRPSYILFKKQAFFLSSVYGYILPGCPYKIYKMDLNSRILKLTLRKYPHPRLFSVWQMALQIEIKTF